MSETLAMVTMVLRKAAATRIKRSDRFCLLLPLVGLALIGQTVAGVGQSTTSGVEDRRARKANAPVVKQGVVAPEEPASDFDASKCTVFQGTTVYK